jgi:putative endonuclease
MTKQSQSYVYILTNKTNTVLYIGVTTNIISIVYQHKTKAIEGFTKKYNVDKLVYFEVFDDITSAITREKRLKGGSRKQKLDLIERENPNYTDLYPDILE